MVIRGAAIAVAVLCGCVSSSSVQCEDGRTCPGQSVCDVTHHLCVTPDQLAMCSGMPDGTSCDTSRGTCHDGVCLPSACGNGLVDVGEACDDGNTRDGDGCSGACTSTETCGNGIVDPIKNELCDDGNHQDHDGCSSQCQLETTDWVQMTDPGPRIRMKAAYDVARNRIVMVGGRSASQTIANTISEFDGVWRAPITAAPPPREEVALAYDHDQRLVYMYGGSDAVTALGETWAWDGIRWSLVAQGPARIAPAMAYDARRHRIVAFGGAKDPANIDQVSDETWEFDGTTWTQATPLAKPPGLRDAAMAYDPGRGVMVMYGGHDSTTFFVNIMWEYDGTTWTQRTPLPVPGLEETALAYSSARHKVIAYGGTSVSGLASNLMYEWDGTTWTQFTGTTPAARLDHVMVEDGRGGLLVYGGRTSTSASTFLSDTWLFDGTTWTQDAAPTPRQEMATATALDEGRVVMFGGKSGSTVYAETWQLTAHGWKQIVGSGPPPTELPTMTYDSARGQLVTFGGARNGTSADNITWLLTGNTWTSTHPTPSPPARVWEGMAFDAAHRVTVIFGGLDASNSALADTWTWDGTSWNQMQPGHSPPARVGMAMAYDPVRGVVVLWGGVAPGSISYNDTWIWDGSDWHDATSATDQPSSRDFATFAWDPPRQSLVLAGGIGGLPDTFESWEWVGAAQPPFTGQWQRVTTIDHPSARAFHAMFTAVDGTGVDIFAGASSIGTGGPLNDLWVLRTDGPRAVDACQLPFDVDGDGLATCDDPDCWFVCTPDCPPGSSCPADVPQCGDGACSPLESCHSCPADCATCTSVCGDFVCDPGETCPGDC